MVIDVWLYGPLARYGGDPAQRAFANPHVCLSEGSSLAALLGHLGLPSSERGITFINGQLSAMPGLQPDLGHELRDGDRVALFHLQSMWPFQYRDGSAMVTELRDEMSRVGRTFHQRGD